MNYPDDFIIYQYTDEQAVKDGVLVPIEYLHHVKAAWPVMYNKRPVDRLTIAVWQDICRMMLPTDCEDPEHGTGHDPEHVKEALLDIMNRFPHSADNELVSGEVPPLGTLWLMRNERNAWTLMYPSDY